MSVFNSVGPAFNNNVFQRAQSTTFATEATMTVRGTINKTLLLVLLAALGAMYTWKIFADNIGVFYVGSEAGLAPEQLSGAVGAVTPFMFGGLIGGLIFSLIAIFSPRRSVWAAPLYAVCEGLCLGALSAMFNYQTNGIVMQAILLTVAVLLIMLLLYRTGTIKVTDKLRSGIIIATGAVALFYLVTWIVSIFSSSAVAFLSDTSLLSIGISLVIVGVAAFNFLLDFDFIEKGSQIGSPKYMEWYGAFGLMLTLVWLYLEMLRLLSKLNRN